MTVEHPLEIPPLLRKLRFYIYSRYLLLGLSLLLLQIRGVQFVESAPYYLLTGVALLNFMYGLFLYFSKYPKISPYHFFLVLQSQILFDSLWVSFLIYLTGGVLSTFIPYYFFAILSGVVLSTPPITLLITTLSITALCIISTVYFLSYHFNYRLILVDHYWITDFGGNFNFILAYLVAQILSFVLVACLGSYLMKSLQQIQIVSEEILDNMGEGVLTLDKFQKLVFMNQKARQFLGISFSQSLIGQTLETIRSYPSQKANKAFWDIFEREENWTQECIVYQQNQRKTLIQLTINLIQNPEQKIRGMIGMLHDLTIMKKMEEAVNLANKLKGIEELAAGIAHEIRNPLTSIRMAIQELQEDFPEKNEYCQIALKEMDRLNHLISEFVRYAHIKKAQKTGVPLKFLFQELINLLQFQKRSPQIQWFLEEEEALILEADEGQLRQAFLNVLNNAVEAIGEEGRISIRIRRSPPLNLEFYATNQEGVCIEIQDTGVGLTEQEKEQIFVPFYTTKKKGTGLGLGIVYRIVKAHDGHIHVESKKGEGTTVYFWFPLRLSSENAVVIRGKKG